MIWKDVEGYEGLYAVSDTGLVRGQNGNIMAPLSTGNGYWQVYLRNKGNKKKAFIHRLVAKAFIPNPENKPFINHKDNNPSNNSVENLEWCTPKENVDWMRKQGRNKRTESWLNNLHKAQEKDYKAVRGTNIKTGEVLEFKFLNSVREMGFQPSCVCDCCKGKRTTHAGYRWEYVNEINNSE
jgi:hypothetical protein